MHNTVFCLATTEPQASSILTELRNLSFSASDISVILPAHGRDTKNISMKEDAIRGAEAGGAFGGILGWIAGFTTLAIPGGGLFIAAGPLVSALAGAVAGGVVGGLAGGSGAVHPLGLPKDVSRRIDERLRAGDIMISVHSDDLMLRRRAADIFRDAGAEIVHDSGEEAAA
jgi:hypothetical protein